MRLIVNGTKSRQLVDLDRVFPLGREFALMNDATVQNCIPFALHPVHVLS